MKYDIKAIPTTYAGVNFRSRLEARWAAFFDLCEWKWDYEPFDLEGWAPDFMLRGKIKALVEVKPINFSSVEKAARSQARASAAKAFTGADAWRANHTPIEPDISASDEEIARYVDAISTNAKPEYEIVVLGNGPFRTDFCNKWGVGVFAYDDLGDEDFADLFWGHSAALDYAARYNNFQYRIGGEHKGDGHLSPIQDDTPTQLWREAGNVVQWKPANSNRHRRSAA